MPLPLLHGYATIHPDLIINTKGQAGSFNPPSTWPTHCFYKGAYSDVDATGFDACGSPSTADYPVDDYLHGKIVELLARKME